MISNIPRGTRTTLPCAGNDSGLVPPPTKETVRKTAESAERAKTLPVPPIGRPATFERPQVAMPPACLIRTPPNCRRLCRAEGLLWRRISGTAKHPHLCKQPFFAPASRHGGIPDARYISAIRTALNWRRRDRRSHRHAAIRLADDRSENSQVRRGFRRVHPSTGRSDGEFLHGRATLVPGCSGHWNR